MNVLSLINNNSSKYKVIDIDGDKYILSAVMRIDKQNNTIPLGENIGHAFNPVTGNLLHDEKFAIAIKEGGCGQFATQKSWARIDYKIIDVDDYILFEGKAGNKNVKYYAFENVKKV